MLRYSSCRRLDSTLIVPTLLRAATITIPIESAGRPSSNNVAAVSSTDASILSTINSFVFRAVHEESFQSVVDSTFVNPPQQSSSASSPSLREDMRRYNHAAYAPSASSSATSNSAVAMRRILFPSPTASPLDVEMSCGIAARNLGLALKQRRFRATLGDGSSGKTVAVSSVTEMGYETNNVISVCSASFLRRRLSLSAFNVTYHRHHDERQGRQHEQQAEQRHDECSTANAAVDLHFSVNRLSTAALLLAIEVVLKRHLLPRALHDDTEGQKKSSSHEDDESDDHSTQHGLHVNFVRCSNWAIDADAGTVVCLLRVGVEVSAPAANQQQQLPQQQDGDGRWLAERLADLLNNGIFETSLMQEITAAATTTSSSSNSSSGASSVALLSPPRLSSSGGEGGFSVVRVVDASSLSLSSSLIVDLSKETQRRRVHFMRLGSVVENAPTALHKVENLFINGFANFFSPRRFTGIGGGGGRRTGGLLRMIHVHMLLRTGDFREAMVALALLKGAGNIKELGTRGSLSSSSSSSASRRKSSSLSSTSLPGDWLLELEKLFARRGGLGSGRGKTNNSGEVQQGAFLELFTELPIARQMEVLTAIPCFEWNVAASRALSIMHGSGGHSGGDQQEEEEAAAGGTIRLNNRFDLRDAASRKSLRDVKNRLGFIDDDDEDVLDAHGALMVRSVAQLFGEKWELVGNAAGRHIFLNSPCFDSSLSSSSSKSPSQQITSFGSRCYDTDLVQRVLCTEVAANRNWPATDAAFFRALAPELAHLLGTWFGAASASSSSTVAAAARGARQSRSPAAAAAGSGLAAAFPSPLAAARPLLVLPWTSRCVVLPGDAQILGGDDGTVEEELEMEILARKKNTTRGDRNSNGNNNNNNDSGGDDDHVGGGGGADSADGNVIVESWSGDRQLKQSDDDSPSRRRRALSAPSAALDSSWTQYLREPARDERTVSGEGYASAVSAAAAGVLKPRPTRNLTTRHGLRSLGVKLDAPSESYLWSALREIVRM